MEPGLRHRLLAWLEDPAVVAQDPEAISELRAALSAGRDASVFVRTGRQGTISCSAQRPGGGSPRLIEFDRQGTLLTVARWEETDRLSWAKLRLPDRRWVGIEPRAMDSPLWGRSDRLWLLSGGAPFRPIEELGHFQAVEYRAVAAIPPLAEPERLPPGAGTTVLNFLAALLVDQGTPRVFYCGPYATEQLFTALLESFRYDAAVTDPLDRFLGSELSWTPAPHERRFLPGGIYVQLRDGVEKVAFKARAYYRRQWQSVIRREPRVVREEGARVICSLWALGAPVEDHLVLDTDGEVMEIPERKPEAGPVEPLSSPWRIALGTLLAHQSAPALGPWLPEALRALRLEWGPVTGDLWSVSGEHIILSLKLPRLFRRRLAECQSRAERFSLGLELIAEVALLLGPILRLGAQRRLASLPEAAQLEALESPPAAPPLTSVEDLARALAGGEGCPLL